MPATPQPTPRARLFEYLRQQEAGAAAERQLSVERMTRIDGQAEAFQLQLALHSWTRPQPVLKSQSAPEPRGHHEFFRTVRP